MATLKKGSKAAKDFMASIRALKGSNPRKKVFEKTSVKSFKHSVELLQKKYSVKGQYLSPEFWKEYNQLVNKNQKTSTKRLLKNPIDHIGARELSLYIDNDAALNRQQLEPIVKNLARKHAKGLYDKTKAIKLWNYLVETGAKKYNKEHGDGTLSLKMFDKDTRNEVAREFEKMYYANVQDMAIDFKPKTKAVTRYKGASIHAPNKERVAAHAKYLVINGKITIGAFPTLKLAKEYATAYANKTNKQIAIKTL